MRLGRAVLAPLTLALVFCSAAPQRRDPGDAVPTGSTRPASPAWQHDWVRDAVFYQVFVRSFRDSDGDGKGDLRGLVEKLDYLNDGKPETTTDLGVTGIWLMPVFESPSYHGYDTVDYETIERDYGTNADFETLCREARKRGIRVIVDLVLNHSGSGHPWFQDAASSPTSAKRDWYVWRADDAGWGPPWGGSAPTWHAKNGAFYYGVFWSGMPDLNWRNAALKEEMKRVAALWLSRGASGYRLDATRYLVETGGGAGQSDTAETHAALREISGHLRRIDPATFLVAENWTETRNIAPYFGDTRTVAGGDEMPSNFNFPLADEILKGVNRADAAGIAAKLNEVAQVYPAGVLDAPFLTNHDQVRLATQLGKSPSKLRNAAAILLTLQGVPFVYYGEELGLENGTTNNDEAKRTPMPWDASPGGGFTTGTPWFGFAPGQSGVNVAAQTADGSSLLSRYRNLIRVRAASEALRRGDLTSVKSTGAVLSFLRRSANERVFVAHNLSDSPQSAGTDAIGITSAENVFTDGSGDPLVTGGALRVSLPPRGSAIVRFR